MTKTSHSPWDLTLNQKNNIHCALDPTQSGCGLVEEEQHAAKDSIRQLAKDAADCFKKPVITNPSREICDSTGRGPAN